MTHGHWRPVMLAFGVAVLATAASAQPSATTLLPPGCEAGVSAAHPSACERQRVLFDFSGVATVADPDSPIRTAGGPLMGTFGLDGATGVVLPGEPDDTLIAIWDRDVTSTGSIQPSESRK